MALIQRRSFLLGLFGAIAAPAIVRAASLMPVKTVLWTPEPTIVQVRHALALALPRCSICFGPFGMCAHSGGPMDLTSPQTAQLLDDRIVAALQEHWPSNFFAS